MLRSSNTVHQYPSFRRLRIDIAEWSSDRAHGVGDGDGIVKHIQVDYVLQRAIARWRVIV